jgi:hypothetical protein
MMDSMEPRPLTWLERTLVAFFSYFQRRSQGWAFAYLDQVVREHGLRGMFTTVPTVDRVWKKANTWFGEQDAHLLAGMGSLWNGCAYCAVGHLWAHNLLFFEKTGELFPLDEAEVMGLLQLPDDEIIAILRQRLAPFEQQRQLVERQYRLKRGAPVESVVDSHLDVCNALYDWVNDCTIQPTERPAALMDRKGRDLALRERYEKARSQARAAQDPKKITA